MHGVRERDSAASTSYRMSAANAEYSRLTENVTLEVLAVQKSGQHLEQMLKMIGGRRDTPALRGEVKQLQLSTHTKVEATIKDLQRLNKVVHDYGDKQQKIQTERLKTNFQDILTIYKKCQEKIAEKMKNHVLINIAQQDDIDNDTKNPNVDAVDDAHKQRLLQQSLQFEHDMIVERHERIHQIEVDIIDINDMMRQMGEMIADQGEIIDEMEPIVEQAVTNVEDGAAELAKAAKLQSKIRKKMIWLLIILFIVAAIVVGIVVSKIHKK